MNKIAEENHKNIYGYLLDPIHHDYEKFENVSEVSDTCILTSFVATLGLVSLASTMM